MLAWLSKSGPIAFSIRVIAGFNPATNSSDWEVSAPDIAMGPRNDPRIKSGDGDDKLGADFPVDRFGPIRAASSIVKQRWASAIASPLMEAVILLPGVVPSLFAKRRVARALPYAVCRFRWSGTGDERKVSAHAFAAIFAPGSHFGSAFIRPPICLAAPGS